MKAETIFFNCGDHLQRTLSSEIDEVFAVIDSIRWSDSFSHQIDGKRYKHQSGYNKAFEAEFVRLGWETQPVLRIEPKLIGDFRKGIVFVEIQFGNSATLYRDYYKFQYGLANGLLSLAVLVVPTKPAAFFPSRPTSVNNMADYALATTCLKTLPINVPTMLVGLKPED
ncbi:MAG: BglII/BstYI family type II restriction endonuclease [Thermodesulfobacteriota bacterium]